MVRLSRPALALLNSTRGMAGGKCALWVWRALSLVADCEEGVRWAWARVGVGWCVGVGASGREWERVGVSGVGACGV